MNVTRQLDPSAVVQLGTTPTYSPWLEARRNLVVNPRMDNRIDNWAVTAPVTQTAQAGGTRVTFPSAAATYAAAIYTAGIAAGPGETYFGALDVTVPAGQPAGTFRASIRTYGGTTPDAYSEIVTIAPGTTVRLTTGVLTTPVGTTSVRLWLNVAAPGVLAGSHVTITHGFVERAASNAGSYFDGATPDAELVQYRWAGTADASASVQDVRENITTTLDVELGDVRLDASWSPYGQGSVTATARAVDVADASDPRTAARAIVTAELDGRTRTFNLGIRTRRIGYGGRTVTFELATDEALLQDHVALVPVTLQRTSSLRSMVNEVLTRTLGAPPPPRTEWLEPGGLDADMTPYFAVANLIANPSIANTTSGYGAGTGTSAIDYSTAVGGYVGTSAIRWTAATTGLARLTTGSTPAVEGELYSASTFVRAAASADGTLVRMGLVFYDDAGAQIKLASNAGITINATAWLRTSITGIVAPPGSVKVRAIVDNVSGTAARNTYADAFMLSEGGDSDLGVNGIVYFDGSTASPGYTTAWDDVAHASTSHRVPLVERDPEIFDWPVGVSAWDFVSVLTQSGQRRLFADEAGLWYLVDETYAEDGTIALTAAVSVEADDEITRDGSDELWATGVAVHYVWESAKRGAQERWDTAGTPSRVRVLEYRKPFPGPGAAAFILRSMQTHGRVQTVQTFTNYDAKPLMEVNLALPDAPITVGRIGSIAFDLKSGLMRVSTKGLGEIPLDSWAARPEAETWATIPGDPSWADWHP